MARCIADSLDAAVDVCDDCGQPFCEGHLVRSRGARKKPLCGECAVVKAGLRHKDVRTHSASRSTVRKNRKMVKSAEVVEQEPVFEYFDLEDPAPPEDATDPAEPAKQKRRLRGWREQSGEPETSQTDDKPIASTQASAADLWEQIRTDDAETEAPLPADDLAPPPPMTEPHPPGSDEWLEPGPFDDEPEPGMPATFATPRSELSPPPSAPPAPTPPSPEAAPVPTPQPRPISPSFAERPTHALPAAFLKAVEADDPDGSAGRDVPAALRPGTPAAPAVPEALAPR